MPSLVMVLMHVHWHRQYVQSFRTSILQVNISDVAVIDLHIDRFTKWKEESNMKDTKKILLENLPQFLTTLKNRYGDSGILMTFEGHLGDLLLLVFVYRRSTCGVR